MQSSTLKKEIKGQYAQVNGIDMYYEIHGEGLPLVLIHGGGSTINTNFGRLLTVLAKKHKLIAVEMQAHGHTGDRDAPETFTQDADDVAELLRQLGIPQADIFGFSNGGQTAIEIALRHPQRVRRLVIASAFYNRAGAPEGFWDGMKQASFEGMPQLYKDEYLKIKDEAALLNMFRKDVQRMQNFTGWTADDLRSIQAPTLVVAGDQDIVTPEHAAEMSLLLPKGRLAILPGTHGSYIGEALTPDNGSLMPQLFAGMVSEFLS